MTIIRILLVEDAGQQSDILRDLINEAGNGVYVIEQTADLALASAAIEHRRHDICIVDCPQGRLDGNDLLRLNSCQPHPRPLIMLTSDEDQGAWREIHRLGAASHLLRSSLTANALALVIRDVIDRYDAMDSLRINEARSRRLLNDNPLPMWVESADATSVLAVDDAALHTYGYSWGAFMQLDPSLGLTSYRSGAPRAERHQRGDGSAVDVEVTTCEVAFDGQPARLVLANNLSTVAAAHRLAEERSATLHTVLRDSVDALIVADADRNALFMNPAALRLLGPSALDGPLQLRGEWTPGHTSESFLYDSSGSENLLEMRVSATEWEGQPALLLALRDITESRAAEKRLQLSWSAMEGSASGILVVDALDPIQPLIYVNSSFERTTGFRRDEVLGRNCRFLQGDERDQVDLPRLREALVIGKDVEIVLRNYKRNGTAFWSELKISPIFSVSGTLTHWIGIQNDITERREHESASLRRLTHDALTGLPNRTLLSERLEQLLMVAPGVDRDLALLCIDLDQFKEVNDALGHDAGDYVLREAASRISVNLRPGDMLARPGGNTFLLMLPDLDHTGGGDAIAARLLEVLAQPYNVAGQSLFCSCSIGVTHSGETGHSASQLILQAEAAMHKAKRAGRNNFQVHRPGVASRLTDRLELRTQLQMAIERKEFVLHFQPQIDLSTQRISGIEALIRWQHPVRGLIGPGQFIPVAEDTGQIVAIGEWALDEACRLHRGWVDADLLDCAVAVNVSGVQFQRATFVKGVQEALARHGLPANRLELELTESIMMEDADATVSKLDALRALGIRLAIDDFGTGFSSLAYLKRLPIDKIKIDQSFVKDITHNSDDASIALSVIAIAHHLRMSVVAEGVETPAQMAFLKRHLCDSAQGFLIARPMPADTMGLFAATFVLPAADEMQMESTGSTLLLVDDEPNILRALSRALRRDGYRILTATSASEAFDVLAANDVHVIMSDQIMPQMRGTEFLIQAKSLYPEVVRMVLSGYTDLASVTEAVNLGAIYRFLTKPWDEQQLRAHVREAFLHQKRLLAA